MDVMSILKQKKNLFLTAPTFAVVGASSSTSKGGAKVFKWLLDHHKSPVPVNTHEAEVQGIKCLQTISQLPDPTHTAVCIVVHPEMTLDILKQAKALDILALWIQPGAEDDTVVKFIQADPQLDERCVYSTGAHTGSIPVASALVHVARTLAPAILPPCLMEEKFPDITTQSTANPVHADLMKTVRNLKQETVHNLETVHASLEQKKTLFFSALKFAVVGASRTDSKNGAKALKFLIEQHKDVVPVNPKATKIQGIKCLQSLSQLPDPTHTAISIVVPPEVALDIVQQAKSLGVFALWLQPGVEDDAVEKFIEADPQLEARTVYRAHPLHTSGSLAPKILRVGPIEDMGPSCLFAPSVPPITTPAPAAASPPTTTPVPAAASLASNSPTSTKRIMLSPPSSPPPNKSQKLSPDDSIHAVDLGQEIPGLA